MTVGPGYFDDMYASDPDPWGFEDRWYERRKYALTMAALPAERYHRAFEPGCSIGVLTEHLAARVDELVAWEPHGPTATRAASRVAALPHVAVEGSSIPTSWPDGRFDLVVLSEVAYYLDDAGLAHLLQRLGGGLAPGGDLVSVHYDGATDYPQTAAGVHETLARLSGLAPVVHHQDDGFALDVWHRS